MALIIQKFGGSSLASFERVHYLAQRVKRARDSGHQVVVVVSAMFGETDRLIQLAQSIGAELYSREYDALVATGEQVSAALMSSALVAAGCPARSFNANQAKIITDAHYGRAAVIDIDAGPVHAELAAGRVPVVAGFQGVNASGDVTTLGRGGSDVTAVALAAALQASECQIFTDVDGIYTSDPNVVKNARRLSHISVREMYQLAELGAKVLQKYAVKLADYYQVPIRVLSSFVDGPGTLVTFDGIADNQAASLSGIAFDRQQAKVTVSGLLSQNKAADAILLAMDRATIDVDMIMRHSVADDGRLDFSFTVHQNDYERALSITQDYSVNMTHARVVGDASIAKLSLVGVGMHAHAGVASKVYQTLAQQGIGVQSIASSEVKVSAVIAENDTEVGARALHAAFHLDRLNASLLMPEKQEKLKK